MGKKKLFYATLVIMLTIFTVVTILNMRVSDGDWNVYDRLDTEEDYGNNDEKLDELTLQNKALKIKRNYEKEFIVNRDI